MTRHRASPRRAGAAAAVLCAIAAGPVAGGQLVLLAKPFGGVVGVPGTVVGYIAVTAAVLGLLIATPWLLWWGAKAAMASGCAVVAGGASMVAGTVDGVVVFTVAVLVAGAATGPLLAVGRTLAFELGRRGLVCTCAAAVVGMAAAAWLAGRYYEDPGGGLIVAGALTAALGLGTGLLALADAATFPPARHASIGAGVRSALPLYLAAGLAIGSTTLPALHLLLFRWNEFGPDQYRWLSLAAAAAAVAVIVPGRRVAAVPVLLVLAAGATLLVAIAPGAASLTIGLALTLSASARALAALDEGVCLGVARADRSAVAGATAAVAVISGLAGLGLVDLLGRLIGTGSALTVSALCVLVTVWSSVWCSARQRTHAAVDRSVS
ncbi:hypothetical protein [Nocardia brasiliensis]|uniref:hypothetical protein n=1 Tax=Nocardia brasiliensis TaxID=37326 RepID=UPI0033E118F9